MPDVKILVGDVREQLAAMAPKSVHCIVTSPPYWALRDYGTGEWKGGDPGCKHLSVRESRADSDSARKNTSGTPRDRSSSGKCKLCGATRENDRQIGSEPTVEEFYATMVEVGRGLWRVLRDDGTLWMNMGDCYSGASSFQGKPGLDGLNARRVENLGSKSGAPRAKSGSLKDKDLVGQAWGLAFAFRDAGWYLRSAIVWCLSGGTRIYARTPKGDGPVMLSDLSRMDPASVKLWNGERWTQVVAWHPSTTGRDGALEIVLRSGERIGCTPGHVWPVGDELLRADQLKIGDCLKFKTLPEPDNPKQPTAIPESVGRFVGLYLAEGSMSGKTIQISGHADEADDRMAWIKPLAEAYGGTARVHVYGNTSNICIESRLLGSILEKYIAGRVAKDKQLSAACWRRSNAFLREILMGYLEGDGHYDQRNDRWRLGFTRNYGLESSLRTLSARLGCVLTLKPSTAECAGKKFATFHGSIKLKWTGAEKQNPYEIVDIRRSRGREFWDVEVADEPHLFALASGILTHNSKPNPLPESVTDRPAVSHEYVFLLTKSPDYFYDHIAVRSAYARIDKMLGSYTPKKDYAGNGVQVPGDVRARICAKMEDPNSGRNLRTVWSIPTQAFPGSHFATFPERLVEPCVRAGTSQAGCCRKCGAPWRRISKASGGTIGKGWHDHANDAVEGNVKGKLAKDSSTGARRTADGERDTSTANAQAWTNGDYKVETLGWEPSCIHKNVKNPVPCTVLDPFGGSGTTASVARYLGRSAVLIELNPKYAAMARKRAYARPKRLIAGLSKELDPMERAMKIARELQDDPGRGGSLARALLEHAGEQERE